MNLLHQIESGPMPRPRRLLIYGTRGIGVSTLAASFPEPIFIPSDDSLHHLDCRRFPVAQRFGQVLKALTDLYKEPHGYRTVVIDPLDSVERLILDEIRRERGVEHIDTILFNKGYAIALDYWQQLLSAVDVLRDDLGITCLLVGRAQNQRTLERTGVAAPMLLDRYAPALNPRASELIQSWCDAVMFATCTEMTTDAKQSERGVLHTTPAKTHVAKNRMGLPTRMRMEAGAFAPYLSVPKPSLTSLN